MSLKKLLLFVVLCTLIAAMLACNLPSAADNANQEQNQKNNVENNDNNTNEPNDDQAEIPEEPEPQLQPQPETGKLPEFVSRCLRCGAQVAVPFEEKLRSGAGVLVLHVPASEHIPEEFGLV